MSEEGQVQVQLPHPNEWGPRVWYVMDIFVKGYGDHPDKALKNAATQFFHSLSELLPCPHCREHYKTLLKKKPIRFVLRNSETLTKWVDWVKGEVEKVVKEKLLEEMAQKNELEISSREVISSSVLSDEQSPPEKGTAQRTLPGAPAINRKRNLGKPRHVPRAHVIGGFAKHPVAAKGQVQAQAQAQAQAKGAPRNNMTYHQRNAANIAANWKGSQAGLQRYIKSERGYNRPCACS